MAAEDTAPAAVEAVRETVLLRQENGIEAPHDLPLPDGIAARVASGQITILGPCDAQGNLLDVPAPESKPDPAPEPDPAKVASKIRMGKRTQDAASQSADNE